MWLGVWSREPDPQNSYCCGRYASYWNAFLFTFEAACIWDGTAGFRRVWGRREVGEWGRNEVFEVMHIIIVT